MPSAHTSYTNGHAHHFTNGANGVNGATTKRATAQANTLLASFLDSHRELEAYKHGKPVLVDGDNLSVAAVAAVSRYNATVELDESPSIRERVKKSRQVIASKVDSGASVYGLSTGFGGSADTRTDQPILLGHALLQHQHAGVLPSSDKALEVLPLLDPVASTSMSESWVRGAMLVRMNSLIRGHSGVRYELIERLGDLLRENITPFVPLRGSISASGDLSPLSYVAGTIVGNPSIRVFDGPAVFGARKIVSSRDALKAHGLEPLPLVSKEHLGILNGTAFSASVGSLAIHEATHLALLAQVCTAMGVEALSGTQGSFDSFIHDVARPHPGQIESAQIIWSLLEGSKLAHRHTKQDDEVELHSDKYSLRQDRYPLRTSPQFLGPQIEDILAAAASLKQEINSTTDNPLVDGETGQIHHGGNFQAMAVTNAMEKTRLALHHIGKLLFAQSTELMNPAMNNGLPPSMAASDPSLNYHGKGIDIATAAYVGELGYLASPVSTHIQSAEMHNQAVNSLALISARATINSLEVLSILTASYLYILCQALDLRALQSEFLDGLRQIVEEELSESFGGLFQSADLQSVHSSLYATMHKVFEKTSTMDNVDRMHEVAASASTVLLDVFARPQFAGAANALAGITTFRTRVADRAATLMDDLRRAYLSGERGAAPATPYLAKTRSVYEFVRVTLGIRMHGSENYNGFPNGIGTDDITLGQNISLIHEAIRDGKLQDIVASLFE
ncbi:L-Aspartase-like protein [Schizophyllum commune]